MTEKVPLNFKELKARVEDRLNNLDEEDRSKLLRWKIRSDMMLASTYQKLNCAVLKPTVKFRVVLTADANIDIHLFESSVRSINIDKALTWQSIEVLKSEGDKVQEVVISCSIELLPVTVEDVLTKVKETNNNVIKSIDIIAYEKAKPVPKTTELPLICTKCNNVLVKFKE